MIIASIIDSVLAPFANLFGWVLAACYSFTHSFGLAIVLLTLATMVVVFPLTRAGTRSMMRMQLLQPELMKIRNRHKTQPGMSTEDKQAARVALNEEMMALYRENNINPTGGCLPMFLQFPIFIILYDVIRGMTRTVTTAKSKVPRLSPEYIPKNTQLRHAVLTSHGHLTFIGLNLADSVRTSSISIVDKIPYVVLILIAVALQYVSIWQITTRNPAAKQGPQQMQAVQKFMPLIFVVIYILYPAGVCVYFIASSAFRILQQEYMYKHDPMVVESVTKIRARQAAEAAKGIAPPRQGQRSGGPRAATAPTASALVPSSVISGVQRRTLRERLRAAAQGFAGAADQAAGASRAGTGASSNGAAVEGAGTPSRNGAATSVAANGDSEEQAGGGDSSEGASDSGNNGSGRAPAPSLSASQRRSGSGGNVQRPRPAAQNRSRDKRRRRP